MFPTILVAKLALGAAMAVSAHHAPAVANTHVVQSGETLYSISAPTHNWQHLYSINRNKIADPNLIFPGEKLVLSGPEQPATTAAVAPAASSAVNHDPFDGKQGDCGDGDGDGMDAPCSVIFPHAAVAATAVVSAPMHHYRHHYTSSISSGSVTPGSSFEACVIARESGGNSQVMNSSGHYGLYQFSASTWAAYGGSSSTFGHASAYEQRRVFLNAMSHPGGASNWSPYDGC